MKLYRGIAHELASMIRNGSIAAGDKLPSVRELAVKRHLSPTTVLHAYDTLVADELIESRPRSGYYVLAARRPERKLLRPRSKAATTRVEVSDLVFEILEASKDRDVIPLGSAFPHPGQFPWAKLARFLGSSARQMNPWSTTASLPPGNLDLRREIARRYLKAGMTVEVEEIIITAGALEALNLSLQTVTRPGDTIAIESPAFYGCLQAVERQRLRVVEIPTDPRTGIDLKSLKQALNKHTIHACWFMTTLHHPTGATAPLSTKREIVRLLSARGIPLIEDDAYAELQFQPTLPTKAFDRQGLVLQCGSFSKSLAPGYRLGWVAAGRFARDIARRKIESSLATSLPIQLGVARMLRHGAYDSHLRRIRRWLGEQQSLALQSVKRHFPAGIRISRASGGYFLWVECDSRIKALDVHRRALDAGISIAPGPMFSARQQYQNCLRLNVGHPWNATMDGAIRRLGQLLAG